jgi:hypothetical protein
MMDFGISKNIKLFLFPALMLLSTIASAQSLLYYTDDRPGDYTYQNALRSVGIKWGIEFIPFSSEVSLDDAISNNNEVSNIVAERSGYGENWLDFLYSETEKTLEVHEAIRTLVRSVPSYQFVADQLLEPLILIQRKKTWFGRHYRVYVIGITKKDSKGFRQVAEYKVKPQKKKVILKSSGDAPLPFELPENGIVEG